MIFTFPFSNNFNNHIFKELIFKIQISTLICLIFVISAITIILFIYLSIYFPISIFKQFFRTSISKFNFRFPNFQIFTFIYLITIIFIIIIILFYLFIYLFIHLFLKFPSLNNFQNSNLFQNLIPKIPIYLFIYLFIHLLLSSYVFIFKRIPPSTRTLSKDSY